MKAIMMEGQWHLHDHLVNLLLVALHLQASLDLSNSHIVTVTVVHDLIECKDELEHILRYSFLV